VAARQRQLNGLQPIQEIQSLDGLSPLSVSTEPPREINSSKQRGSEVSFQDDLHVFGRVDKSENKYRSGYKHTVPEEES
jgi:hypothetical protein